MFKDCAKSQGYRLKTIFRKKSNTNIATDTFYNAEIAEEGDLKTQLLGVLKNKISILPTSKLKDMFLNVYLRLVPNGKIVD
jgi:hypothetical protein